MSLADIALCSSSFICFTRSLLNASGSKGGFALDGLTLLGFGTTVAGCGFSSTDGSIISSGFSSSSVLLPVLVLVLVLPCVLHYQSLLRLPLSYINIIDNFLYFQNLVPQIRFVQSFQFEGSVSDIIAFYLDDFVGLIAPL